MNVESDITMQKFCFAYPCGYLMMNTDGKGLPETRMFVLPDAVPETLDNLLKECVQCGEAVIFERTVEKKRYLDPVGYNPALNQEQNTSGYPDWLSGVRITA